MAPLALSGSDPYFNVKHVHFLWKYHIGLREPFPSRKYLFGSFKPGPDTPSLEPANRVLQCAQNGLEMVPRWLKVFPWCKQLTRGSDWQRVGY